MKGTFEIKDGHGFRNFLIVLCLTLAGFSCIIWNKYQSEVKDSQIKAENASMDYKLRGDSIATLKIKGDSIDKENKKIQAQAENQKHEYKAQLISQEKKLKEVEDLPGDEQVHMFAEKTKCEPLVTNRGIIVPIEGIKTANILIEEGEQAKTNMMSLKQIIEAQNRGIKGLQSSCNNKDKQITQLESQKQDLNITIDGQNLDIGNKDKKISNQNKIIKGSLLVVLIALIL